jgi:hypothetical protein
MNQIEGVVLCGFYDYYDGPINGMAVYQDRECWFEMVADRADWYRGPRRFTLYELSSEQRTFERARERCFAEHVRGADGQLKPEAQWHGYYDRYPWRESPVYPDNPVIGWFDKYTWAKAAHA